MDVSIRLIWKSYFGKKEPDLLECHPFFLTAVFDSNLPMAITNNDNHLQEGPLTPFEYMQKEDKTGQPGHGVGSHGDSDSGSSESGSKMKQIYA